MFQRYVFTSVGVGDPIHSEFASVGDGKTCMICAPLVQVIRFGQKPELESLGIGEVLIVNALPLQRRNS